MWARSIVKWRRLQTSTFVYQTRTSYITTAMDKVRISTVTPVYQGVDYLEKLVSELDILRSRLSGGENPIELCESIFVDDDSTDASSAILANLEQTYDWVRVITLSRNFGQHAATIAGVLYSSGDWVITLDEDLQHPPAYIPLLLAQSILNGKDVMYANPGPRPHESYYRNLSSRVIKKLVAKLSGTEHVESFNSFRVIRGDIARAAAAVSPAESYYDVSLTWFTDRVATCRVDLHDPRSKGKSGYRFHTLLTHARRLVLVSEFKMTRVGSLMGLTALFMSVVIGTTLLFLAIVFSTPFEVRGWLSLMLGILFFGGLIATMIGISLEFTSITYRHLQGKPAFFTVDRRKDVLLEAWAKGVIADENPSIKSAA